MARHTLCKEADIAVGEMKPFTVADTKVLVYRLDDGFYATQHNCTHIMAPLEKGKLVDNTVQCPFHRARFDVRTGEVVAWASFPPGLAQLLNVVRKEKALATYPVSVEDGELMIDV